MYDIFYFENNSNMKKRIGIFLLLLLIFIGIIILFYDFFKTKANNIYEIINSYYYLNNSKKEEKITKQKINITENITEVTQTDEEKNEENVQNNKEEDKNNPIAFLEIPKINLYRSLYNKDNPINNISKNVKIMNEATFPDVDYGNFILAAHSGTGSIAFFKDLHKISINDKVYVYFNNIKYEYNIKNIYDEIKDGTISLIKDPNETVITLITCKYKDKTKQTIYVGNLVNKTNY